MGYDDECGEHSRADEKGHDISACGGEHSIKQYAERKQYEGERQNYILAFACPVDQIDVTD